MAQAAEKDGGSQAERANLRDTKELRDAIMAGVEGMQALDERASQVNAEREAIRTRMEELGINRHAFRHACAFNKLDEQQRDGFDLSMMIARRAIGLPLQGDLFGSKAKE